jgi:excinuclease ABC subunit A
MDGTAPVLANSTSVGDPADEAIRIRGCRVHNLKNLDLDIPRDKLVVLTGPSGSGKSSLAFDTIFAEGQRQYLETLSVYARQFVQQMERPDVDLVEGLQPTISIDQLSYITNPRSTVATVTEIYDYLRLLMTRLGEPTCYQCGTPICHQSPEEIVETLCELPEGTKAILLAPLVRGRKGAHADVFATIRKAGFVRARVDGEVFDMDHLPELAPRKAHTIEAVVDRIVVREGAQSRVAESLNLALKHGDGAVVALWIKPGADASSLSGWNERLFSTLYACPTCKTSFPELEPRSFSFNSPYGACPKCEGLGSRVEFDLELLLPDETLSRASGVIAPWKNGGVAAEKRHHNWLEPFVKLSGVEWTTPLAEFKPKARQQLLNGDGKKFLGLMTLLEKEYVTATKPADRERLEAFRSRQICNECGGARLRPEARAVRIGGKAIHEITAMTVRQATSFFAGLTSQLPEENLPIAQPLVSEIGKRLDFLERVGVDYLALDRPADTLSGGEMQRVRLATGIGAGLVGVCYVLDEPSIGLHPRDNSRLIEALVDLQRQGNTVLVVEHDEAMMRAAEHLIDIGPGAGVHGGQIVAQGTVDEVCANSASITGRYLTGELEIPVPASRRKTTKTHSITIEGVTTHNLKNVEARVPLGALVCVTGVSGSGKSSLVNETLSRAVARRLGLVVPKPGPHVSLRGASQIDKLVQVDQSPIGRSPRSNPATFTGVFDEIRKVFAGTREARQLGYKASRFSFNVAGGRCEECRGQGVKRIEMNFLPDLTVTCPVCGGARFNLQTLQVRYRDKSVAEVLDLPVEEATEFFKNFPPIARPLDSLRQVGLGYLTLGQSATTLSGGEAQRVKLATELARTDTGKTLYILDEPTTGLHFDDIKNLLIVLNRLVDLGNTVLVIEHNLDVIKSADWLIDLGPEGGDSGGYVLAAGTPEEIAAIEDNSTGRFLRPLLEKHLIPLGERFSDA